MLEILKHFQMEQ